MEAKFNAANAAYGRALNQLQNIEKVAGVNDGDKVGAGSEFADLLKNSVNGAVESAQASEATSLKSVTGDVGLTDIVTAVSSAEVTLQTVVAVRDKVIDAYQEIIRMPI